MTAVVWSEAERKAWEWHERLPPSQWCPREMHIPANAINPEPGPYDLDRTPYLREILDTAVDPVVREIWFYKPTQVGFTRMLINLVCYWSAQDPGAIGVLYPDEDTVEEVFAEELKPTIDASPAMKRLKSSRAWDNTKDEVWLTTCPIFGLYAGSVQKLARRSLRYVIGDEINKYRPFKNEASPIQLLKKRTSNWLHRARELYGSTPTTRDGNITIGYESCPDKREYWCKCPWCGEYEVWQWSQVKGFRDAPGSTKFERANWVKLNQPAYYECSHCGEKITDAQKTAAVAQGRWASKGQAVRPDGTLDGLRELSAKVGFHITSMVSPWLTFSDLAAEFIEAEGDPDKTRDFRNARLALPWDEVVKTVRPSAVRDKKQLAGPPQVVPKWATGLIATADTQKDWFTYTVRAWGWGYKSALVHYGEAQSFDELYRICFESRFQNEAGGVYPYSPAFLLIDSGGTKDEDAAESRTSEVYEFSMRDPRILPVKGSNTRLLKPWVQTTLANGQPLIRHDPDHYKDMCARLIGDPDPTKWLPHNDVPEQYCLEMASQHKIRDPKTGRLVWANTGTVRREAWDCERLQCLGADMANIGVQPPQATKPADPAPQQGGGGNWATGHRGRW